MYHSSAVVVSLFCPLRAPTVEVWIEDERPVQKALIEKPDASSNTLKNASRQEDNPRTPISHESALHDKENSFSATRNALHRPKHKKRKAF